VDELTESGVPVVEVTRRIKAPMNVVFSFLVDPTRFVRWMSAKAELDPRPGGRYRLTMATGEIASGVYEVIEPPQRLVFTWGWEGNPALPPGSTTVEITLSDEGDVTVLRLRHLQLPDEGTRDTHAEGWTMLTGRLMDAIEAA
jgi:uncharacterized protein YndB with AHSA1/START domain